MNNREEKLESRFLVTKLTNPDKKVDGIVLEFDDPVARVGIRAWAKAMRSRGYEQVYQDIREKLTNYPSVQEDNKVPEPIIKHLQSTWPRDCDHGMIGWGCKNCKPENWRD